MRHLAFLALALPILATQACAEEVRPYSAQETIQHAQVGTHSPRLAPPVRVAPARTSAEPERRGPSHYDRMDCRPDPSRPLDRAIICRPAGAEKVK